MNRNAFVTEEDLMEERTPQNLIDWWDEKYKSITEQEGGVKALRMKEGLCKVFMEEVYPLRILAELQFNSRNDIKLQSIIGNQNYDALITDHSFSPPFISKLEITQAHEGEDEYLRSLSIQKKGWTGFGSITKSGTKNTGIEVDSPIVARPVQDSLNFQIKLIKDALNKKLAKSYESNTSLLIMFDDLFAYLDPNAKEIINRSIQDEWEKMTNFSTLYLASRSQKIFLKYSVDNDQK